MGMNPREMASLLVKEIEESEAKDVDRSVGTVVTVGDGIATVYGLPEAMLGELLSFSTRTASASSSSREPKPSPKATPSIRPAKSSKSRSATLFSGGSLPPWRSRSTSSAPSIARKSAPLNGLPPGSWSGKA